MGTARIPDKYPNSSITHQLSKKTAPPRLELRVKKIGIQAINTRDLVKTTLTTDYSKKTIPAPPSALHAPLRVLGT